ncbi:hypothetical protein [Prodigiosinella confusarubida]|nr:hypothetical protein [Serratia sp. ATCC 39006]
MNRWSDSSSSSEWVTIMEPSAVAPFVTIIVVHMFYLTLIYAMG